MASKSGEILIKQVIFITLNILVGVFLIVFLIRFGTGELEKEQVYAKKIAMIIDSAKPGTLVVLNVADAVEVVKKNKLNESEMFKIDSEKNLVITKFGRYKSYEFVFFSGLDVNLTLAGNNLNINLGRENA